MSLPTYVHDAKAVRISVYYEGTQTIQEGMPMCYNDDTTTNWTAVDRNSTAGTYDTDTPEGSQNEGKFIRVEDPASTNLMWFAGVVAAGSPGIGAAGPKVVDIFVPNGAIVPVRSSLSSTVGVTVFAIRPAVYTLTQPTYGGSTTSARAVAIAEETVDRSSTNGLCLARLDPNMFLCQGYGVSANQVLIGTGVSTEITLIPNFLSYKSAQTDGDFSVLRVRGEINGAGGSAPMGVIRCELAVNSASQGTPSGLWPGSAMTSTLIAKTGATLTGTFVGLNVGVENQDATPATVSAANLYAISCRLQCNTNAPAELAQMYFASDGSADPGYWFVAKAADAVKYLTTGTATIANGAIKVKIGASDVLLATCTGIS